MSEFKNPDPPPWLRWALQHIGATEIPGPQHSSLIQGWLLKLGAWWSDDETPWCGVFVAASFQAVGGQLPKHWMRARAWLDWGEPLYEPRYGCVVVFSRDGGGHVGFVVGKDSAGRLQVLGGNQGNKVSIAPFDRGRVLGYRWPLDAVGEIPRTALPLVNSAAAASVNEA